MAWNLKQSFVAIAWSRISDWPRPYLTHLVGLVFFHALEQATVAQRIIILWEAIRDVRAPQGIATLTQKRRTVFPAIGFTVLRIAFPLAIPQ
jgi:hypothetical protein